MRPIRAVLFDFYSTLIDQGDTDSWITAAQESLGASISDATRAELNGYLDHIWNNVSEFDPNSERDKSSAKHREIFEQVLAERFPDFSPELVEALYDKQTDSWVAYADAVPVLGALRAEGVKTAIVSNAGIDIRPVIVRTGLINVIDKAVISGEVGVVKPQPEIFTIALDALEVSAEDTLMVGDSAGDDSGGARIGIRTLLLPRTRGVLHGLDAVQALVRASSDGI